MTPKISQFQVPKVVNISLILSPRSAFYPAGVGGTAPAFGTEPRRAAACADSALGRAADLVLAIPDAPEAAEGVDAPTTSTTLQIALGDALAVALMERRGFTSRDFREFHPGGKLGAALKTVAEVMHRGPELPLVAAGASMPDTLLVMTEKRFGCAGVTGADGITRTLAERDHGRAVVTTVGEVRVGRIGYRVRAKGVL